MSLAITRTPQRDPPLSEDIVIQTTRHGFSTIVRLPYEQAVQRAREELARARLSSALQALGTRP